MQLARGCTAPRTRGCKLMLQADVSQALSSEAAALLGDHPPEVQAALQAYGRHLGIAYQVRTVSAAIVT